MGAATIADAIAADGSVINKIGASGLAVRRDETGGDIETALAVANACGALAARTLGARTYLSWVDVKAMLDIEE